MQLMIAPALFPMPKWATTTLPLSFPLVSFPQPHEADVMWLNFGVPTTREVVNAAASAPSERNNYNPLHSILMVLFAKDIVEKTSYL